MNNARGYYKLPVRIGIQETAGTMAMRTAWEPIRSDIYILVPN